MSFKIPYDIELHGFAGTFSCKLYDDVMMSIEPSSHSAGLFSWFPVFVPLTTPVYVKAGESFTISIWRCCNEKQVWYEWCTLEPTASQIQNIGGQHYYIGL